MQCRRPFFVQRLERHVAFQTIERTRPESDPWQRRLISAGYKGIGESSALQQKAGSPVPRGHANGYLRPGSAGKPQRAVALRNTLRVCQHDQTSQLARLRGGHHPASAQYFFTRKWARRFRPVGSSNAYQNFMVLVTSAQLTALCTYSFPCLSQHAPVLRD